MNRIAIIAAAFIVVIPAAAPAGVPECDALKGQAATEAGAVLESEFMYDCCDDTISKCLAGRPECRQAAERVARHVCRHAAAGDGRQSIVRSLEKRAISVGGPMEKLPGSFSPGAVAGGEGAPITVIMYTCARCPFCSKLIPKLHQEATSGRLTGRVRLVLRPFPIKSHKDSAEANQAFAAAIELGRGWEFLLEAYRRFDSFSVGTIPAMATAAGMASGAFEKAYAADSTRTALVEAKKEGLRLGVESTPTLFINGRLYQSELDVETVVDVVLELLDAEKVQPAGLK